MGKELENANEIFMQLYEGEKKRDASSKIRGYLFQDLVAVSKLINENTECIFLEYIEDILVVTKNATYIIQVKYYPKGTVNIKEIVRELYYQYLCLQLLGYKAKIIPVLAVYSSRVPDKPTLREMKEMYIGKDEDKEPQIPKDINDWLTQKVYSLNKEEAESECFKKFAYNKSMQDFLDVFNIVSDYKSIKNYRESIADKLTKLDMNECVITDVSQRKNIMLALAIRYIEEQYNDNLTVSERVCKRDIFVEYIKENLCVNRGKCIGAYLNSVVLECWEDIIENFTGLSESQESMLACIRDNTMKWLFEQCSTVEGQLQLLYTVSNRTCEKLEMYSAKSFNEQYVLFCEHHESIIEFLSYFWKIITNINQDLLNRELIEDDKKRLSPQNYINQNEKRYICINFPDETSESVAILPNACGGRKEFYVTNIFRRMQIVRPRKWYMCGNYRGSYTYDLNVAEIIKGNTVSSIENQQFRIECMQCINISGEAWKIPKCCEYNVFSDRCDVYKEKVNEVE